MKRTIEHYYAIRIGNPKTHMLYFMWQAGYMTPQLFTTRKEAWRGKASLGDGTIAKVVRVTLSELPPK